MAEIVPFKGLRYNQKLIPDQALVTTPPYDVISPSEQDYYYHLHPHNVIRLELGRTFEQDTPVNNQYTRAASYLAEWRQKGILRKDTRQSLYVYKQEFIHQGGSLVRTGLLTGIRLVDYAEGIVLPHEETLPKAKADRLELLRMCKANFSSIFGLYHDPAGQVKSILHTTSLKPPLVSITDGTGVTHRLWVIVEEDLVSDIRQSVSDLKIYIADGHHRYETALQYSKEMAAKGIAGYDYVMTTLVDWTDPGLVIFPTHRMVSRLTSFEPIQFLQQLEQYFYLDSYRISVAGLEGLLDQVARAGNRGHAFGLYMGGDQFHIIFLRESIKPEQFAPAGKSSAWASLDVSVLHNVILENTLSIGSQERANESNLTYTREAEEAIRDVREGKQQLVFLLNPTKLEQIIEVAGAGDKMPQKSTYFYPKLLTGMVLNPLGGS